MSKHVIVVDAVVVVDDTVVFAVVVVVDAVAVVVVIYLPIWGQVPSINEHESNTTIINL